MFILILTVFMIIKRFQIYAFNLPHLSCPILFCLFFCFKNIFQQLTIDLATKIAITTTIYKKSFI